MPCCHKVVVHGLGYEEMRIGRAAEERLESANIRLAS
jgi:hypothetical protein